MCWPAGWSRARPTPRSPFARIGAAKRRLEAIPLVIDRARVDLPPLDPASDRLRLLSYIWPDQPERFARTEAVLGPCCPTRDQRRPHGCAKFLSSRLSLFRQTTRSTSSITQSRGNTSRPRRRLQGRALCSPPPELARPKARPLARIGMEADSVTGSAAVTATLWPGGQRHTLGRADFHGRWVHWQAPRPEDVPW